MTPVSVLCVPYAGATGLAYARLSRRAGPELCFTGLDLPGRGGLADRPPPRDVAEAVAALSAQAAPVAGAGVPYAVLGHSLGALLAHRLTAALSQGPHQGPRTPPSLLVVSCCPPPHLADRLGAGAEELLGAAARELRATSGRAGADRTWAAGRPDLELGRELTGGAGPPDGGPRPVDVPVLALYGADDPLFPGRAVRGWERWTRAGFTAREVPGGHFCFREHAAAYVTTIREALHGIVPGPGAPAADNRQAARLKGVRTSRGDEVWRA
ncbi:thioesterase II family protein [Streptomyces syringium]|uniref:thioesterase II family protein n=1 Tax=Streptomyces syringium TaxID=76729 RepID=UPI003AB01E11